MSKFPASDVPWDGFLESDIHRAKGEIIMANLESDDYRSLIKDLEIALIDRDPWAAKEALEQLWGLVNPDGDAVEEYLNDSLRA